MIKKVLTIIPMLFAMSISNAQNIRDSVQNKVTLLDDVMVYSSRFAEKLKRVAQTIDIINNKPQLNFQNNTADAIIQSGKLFVQKSQQGGGSPVIRGFEASRILTVVDGVRMNNAIYRAGHLQILS